MAQKVMYEKFGNNFVVRFLSKGFPNSHCPQDLAEQFSKKLQVLMNSLLLISFFPDISFWKLLISPFYVLLVDHSRHAYVLLFFPRIMTSRHWDHFVNHSLRIWESSKMVASASDSIIANHMHLASCFFSCGAVPWSIFVYLEVLWRYAIS